ncbi:MAG: hypothetical protein AAB361_02995 [Patescibacteria group bacterium]
MILRFKYNLEKDIYNYLAINGAKYKGGNSHALDYYFKKFPDGPTEDNLKKFIIEYVDYNHIDINQKLASIQEFWAKIEAKFINKMNRLFKINFPLEKIIAYLTTADRCTLGSDYFFVAVFGHQQNKIIMHELLHFYTYIAFEKEFSQLDEKQIYDVKETITELLNQEFSDLIKISESGYPQHKELREKFRLFWREEKDIKKTVNRLIDFIKQL